MDTGVRRPREQEEADDGAEDAGEGRHETMFRRAEAAGQDIRDEVEVEVEDVGEDADETGDEDAEEDDAGLAEVEAVHGPVDEREDLEEGIVGGVDDGGVDVDEGDGGVFDGDLEGLDQRVDGDGRGLEVFLGYLRLCHEALVAGEFAQAGGAAEQDVRGRGFGRAEEHQDEDGPGDPDYLPEGPAPAFHGDGEAGEEGPHGGTAVGGRDPEGHRVGQFEEGVHVLHCCPAGREAGATQEAL